MRYSTGIVHARPDREIRSAYIHGIITLQWAEYIIDDEYHCRIPSEGNLPDSPPIDSTNAVVRTRSTISDGDRPEKERSIFDIALEFIQNLPAQDDDPFGRIEKTIGDAYQEFEKDQAYHEGYRQGQFDQWIEGVIDGGDRGSYDRDSIMDNPRDITPSKDSGGDFLLDDRIFVA